MRVNFLTGNELHVIFGKNRNLGGGGTPLAIMTPLWGGDFFGGHDGIGGRQPKSMHVVRTESAHNWSRDRPKRVFAPPDPPN